jgi:glycosyltransferase involved in cell wall biosynthesis
MKDITGATLRSPLLIYVGSERPRKNLQLLFNTLKRLKERHPAIQLLKIGRAGNARLRETTLRQLRDCGLQIGNDVIITDYVSERDLALAYRSANLFVSPSLYEGFCLPALEALACATPVVCTNREWAMEVVGRAGWLADPEPDALCEIIGDALSSADTPRKVLRGLARAHELSWERTGSNFLCAFETVFQHSTVKGRDGASVALGA